jgi:hypothetical protein
MWTLVELEERSAHLNHQSEEINGHIAQPYRKSHQIRQNIQQAQQKLRSSCSGIPILKQLQVDGQHQLQVCRENLQEAHLQSIDEP